MASPNSRDTLIEYCKRKLGDPVIEINVDEDQLEDRVDEAIQLYQEYHSDATVKTYFKHLVTADDVTNEYIPISSNIIYIARLFPIHTSSASRNFFDVKYQLMLNDMWDLNSVVGGIAYYEQTQQYLSMLDMKLNGTPQVTFARRQNRLYVHGDFQDKDIKAGDYIVAEVYQTIDPQTHTSIYNDMFIKDYTTALIKQQWGANLIKFEGMQLPGGVSLNGRQIYEDATSDVEQLKERLRLEQELPPSFYVG
tara:strand:+ start:14413 stop:15165 length:753 start_codon:yes stop_codon:yes gene_type:complete